MIRIASVVWGNAKRAPAEPGPSCWFMCLVTVGGCGYCRPIRPGGDDVRTSSCRNRAEHRNRQSTRWSPTSRRKRPDGCECDSCPNTVVAPIASPFYESSIAMSVVHDLNRSGGHSAGSEHNSRYERRSASNSSTVNEPSPLGSHSASASRIRLRIVSAATVGRAACSPQIRWPSVTSSSIPQRCKN